MGLSVRFQVAICVAISSQRTENHKVLFSLFLFVSYESSHESSSLVDRSVIIHWGLQAEQLAVSFLTQRLINDDDDDDDLPFILQFQCCGSSDLNDWDINRYFKCGGPSPEECGVPYSCCVREPDEVILLQMKRTSQPWCHSPFKC